MVGVLVLEVKVLNSAQAACVPLEAPWGSKEPLVLSVVILGHFYVPFPGGDLERLHVDDNLVAEVTGLHIHVLACVVPADDRG